jgi:1,4-alpha-glucan branching enzyme
MRTGTMVPYAVRRTQTHITRFHKLADDIEQGKIDIDWLEKVEYMDNIFPDLDYRVYRPLHAQVLTPV